MKTQERKHYARKTLGILGPQPEINNNVRYLIIKKKI